MKTRTIRLLSTKIYLNNSLPYIVMLLIGALYTMAVQAFIQVAGTFSTGLSSLSILLTYIFDVLDNWFALLNFLINLPLLIIFWNKNSRKFTYRTLMFLFSAALFGLLFLNKDWQSGFQHLLFPLKNSDGNFYSLKEIRNLIWPIIILVSIGGLAIGLAMGMAFKFGGSTGGIDIITNYYSHKKKKSIGAINTFISTIILINSMAIYFLINNDNALWFIMAFMTILHIFIVSFITNLIYPKYSIVSLRIASTKNDIVENYLKSPSFGHAFEIITTRSGRYETNKKIYYSKILLLERKSVIKKLISLDPNIWIASSKTERIWGVFNTKYVDSRE